MNKIYFENQGTNTYLVYQLDETDELDTLGLGMLTNNSIHGFAPASFTQIDMTKYIKYNVSAKVSVKQLFSGPVNKKRLIGVFSGVVDAMLSAEEYMLDPSSVLLDMDYIFADVTTCETELVCLPLMNLQHENQNLTMFFKDILFTTQFDQTENCDHVAQLINYLNSNHVLVLTDFKALLNSISQSSAAQPAPVQPTSVATPFQPKPTAQPVQQPEVKPVQSVAQKPIPAQLPVQPQKPAAKKEVHPPVVPAMGSSLPKAPQVSDKEKPMSFFYLMQHYNKENAAIYKAQQEAAKVKKATPSPAAVPEVPAKAASAKPQSSHGFAVPGQAAHGFAIPGQPAPSPTPAVPTPAPVPTKPVPTPQQTIPQQPAVQPTPTLQTVPQPAYQPQSSTPLNFGETTVLSGPIGETTVLGVAAEPNRPDPHLIRAKNNEKIPLNKPVFRIGKERSYVDYFISDNTAISRGHANIIDHNGEFYIVDTNSTNHTYVNGAMIQSGVETKLTQGTKIRLANEDFEFRMY